jgi:hypothetical protein
MRGFLLLWARIAISGILLYFALRGINFAEIQARLNASSAPWFITWMLLAVLTNIVQIFLGVMRWQEISECAAQAAAGLPLQHDRHVLQSDAALRDWRRLAFLVFGFLNWPWLRKWWPTQHAHTSPWSPTGSCSAAKPD